MLESKKFHEKRQREITVDRRGKSGERF